MSKDSKRRLQLWKEYLTTKDEGALLQLHREYDECPCDLPQRYSPGALRFEYCPFHFIDKHTTTADLNYLEDPDE